MLIVVPKETQPGENRVPLVPDSVKKLVRAGAEIQIEAGMGAGSGFSDQEFVDVGATVNADRQQLYPILSARSNR